MTTPTLLTQQIEIATAALQRIYEDTDDIDARHAAEHALVKIKRLEIDGADSSASA